MVDLASAASGGIHAAAFRAREGPGDAVFFGLRNPVFFIGQAARRGSGRIGYYRIIASGGGSFEFRAEGGFSSPVVRLHREAVAGPGLQVRYCWLYYSIKWRCVK